MKCIKLKISQQKCIFTEKLQKVLQTTIIGAKKGYLSEDKQIILLSNYIYRLAYHSNKNITASNYRLTNE